MRAPIPPQTVPTVGDDAAADGVWRGVDAHAAGVGHTAAAPSRAQSGGAPHQPVRDAAAAAAAAEQPRRTGPRRPGQGGGRTAVKRRTVPIWIGKNRD